MIFLLVQIRDAERLQEAGAGAGEGQAQDARGSAEAAGQGPEARQEAAGGRPGGQRGNEGHNDYNEVIMSTFVSERSREERRGAEGSEQQEGS